MISFINDLAIVEQVSATLGGVDILVNNVCGC
jgi:hypothetical protein